MKREDLLPCNLSFDIGFAKITNRKGIEKIYFPATFPPTFGLRKLQTKKEHRRYIALQTFFVHSGCENYYTFVSFFPVYNLGISILRYYSDQHKNLEN
jgi:hypothetical protein